MPSSSQKIAMMRLGGKKLAKIKLQLKEFTQVGTTFEEIEQEAQRLIKAAGSKPSFSMVEGYSWATCVMVNDELCHGIPQKNQVDDGDVVTIDVGLFESGYHLDTSITFGVGKLTAKKSTFIENGQTILDHAIDQARSGNSVYDISKVMEQELNRLGYGAVYQLTGHGIGEELHMDPAVPCIARKSDKKNKLYSGQTVAIEVMYTAGRPDLEVADDGWTYQTSDKSLSGMFEETVLITADAPEVLTLGK